MALVVGDIGTIIELDITDTATGGPTNFIPGTDTVNFVFEFTDGTKLTGAGIFVTGSKARYTTKSSDVFVQGITKVQLQITSAVWTGSTYPLFVIDTGKKL